MARILRNVWVKRPPHQQQAASYLTRPFERTGISARGKVLGKFRGAGVQPLVLDRLKAYGVNLSPSIFQEVHEVKEK